MTRFRVLDDAKPLYREPLAGARGFFCFCRQEEQAASAAALSMRMPRAKCPFLKECCKTQFCPLPGRSHQNAADHHRGTPVHVCLAYSDDQQNERGRAAYARRRCPSMVRVAAAQPPHVFGGEETSPLSSPPIPPLLYPLLCSGGGRRRGSRWSPRPAALAGRATAGATSGGDRPRADDAGALTKPGAVSHKIPHDMTRWSKDLPCHL